MSRIKDDTTTITGITFLRAPKNIAKIVFFYVFLVLFKVCLTAIIRINAVTICSFGFHCRAMELLHQTQALLNFKDYR